MVFVWIALIAVFSAVESFTMQLVGVWFAGGAFASAVAELLGADLAVQITVFFAVSVLLLLTTRPLAKRLIKREGQKTNAESLIGRELELSEEVDNIRETGKATLNGVSWTVRSSSGEQIQKGTLCRIERIEGVKLIVSEKGKD